MPKVIWDLLGSVKYPHQWVSWRAAGVLAVVFAVLAWYLIPGLGFQIESLRGIQVLVSTCAGLLIVGLWYLARECYWRFGGRHRVALAFEGVGVSFDVLHQTQANLRTIANEFRAGGRPVIRIVPYSAVRTAGARKRLSRKYQFELIISIVISPMVGSNGEQLTFKLHHESSEITKLPGFADALRRALTLTNATLPKPESLFNLLDHRCTSVFELILVVLSFHRFAASQYSIAAGLLSELDRRLGDRRVAPTQAPRNSIRQLHMFCLISPSGYDPQRLDPDTLSMASRDAQVAVELYSTQFPEVLIVQARNLFFYARYEDARACVSFGDSGDIDTLVKAMAVLDIAVLELIMGNWDASAAAFSRLLKSPLGRKMDWKSLITFADVAREMNVPHVEFLGCLYRKLGSDAGCPPELEEPVLSWLNKDSSRRELQRFYLRQAPIRNSGESGPPPRSASVKRAKAKKKR